jgi:hypothetical protein
MTKAWDIALNAHDQAIAAAEAKAEERRKEEEAEKARKLEVGRERFEKALPTLNEWFPGVEWVWELGGDFQHDVIVTDKADGYRPSFKLCVTVRKSGEVEVQVGDYRADSSMQGYSYFSGTPIRSAADLGAYLIKQGDRL